MAQNPGFQFTLREVDISYDTNSKSFVCDKDKLLSMLGSFYPNIYQQLCVSHPEISQIPWQRAPDSNVDEDTNTKTNTRPNKRGIFQKIKKGITKIVNKLTPKKYRKKIPLDD